VAEVVPAVLPARVCDVPVLAATLADAFDGDPVWDWMVPPRARRGRLARVFGRILTYAVPRGRVFTTADRSAVAIWAPPGSWKLPLPAVVRSAPTMALAAGTRLPRLLGRLGEIERVHAAQPPDHWYLEFIGTASSARGRGVGAALMADALARFDQMGLPVYLESSNPRNLRFYRRHGFEVADELRFRSGPPQWTLWRHPPA
jgi:GNAT superfamily N-acetyltransferase